jgi:ribosome maturation protein Sdo1
MPNTATRENSSSFINKTQLLKIKQKAMRAGVWFQALPRIDRVLVDLSIKVAVNIRSFTLANNIRAVMKKLEALMESKLSQAIRLIGLPLAQKISSIAQKWGNATAKLWASDSSFVCFLAVTNVLNLKNLQHNIVIKR